MFLCSGWTVIKAGPLSSCLASVMCTQMSDCTNYNISQFFFSGCCRLWFFLILVFAPVSCEIILSSADEVSCHNDTVMTEGISRRSQKNTARMYDTAYPASVSTSDTFNNDRNDRLFKHSLDEQQLHI